MTRHRLKILFVFVLSLCLSGALAGAAPTSAVAVGSSPLAFRDAMRKLWEDHITWTRLYIIDVASDLPEKDATAQRLLQNQADIGNAIKPYYGDSAGDKLAALLKDHILGAADLLAAAKGGDKAKVDAASAKWYANGDEIAAFLNSANPRLWPLDTMKATMKMHLDLTLAEAVARLQGKYSDDIADYDQIHQHILGMADALSTGIIGQFPDKFDQRNTGEAVFHQAMRKLWEDHVTWTRLYIVSASANLPDKDLTAQRLLQNQADIGNAIKPYYGEAAGSQLTSLLRDHILGAADLLAAAKAGDSAKVSAASAKWYTNADQIAQFLNSANPGQWPLDALKSGMKMHLDMTLAEAVAHLGGKSTDDIADYDRVHEHILGLADTLSGGIVAQFPGKFQPATLPTTGSFDHSAHAPSDSNSWLGVFAGLSGLLMLAAGAWLLRSRSGAAR